MDRQELQSLFDMTGRVRAAGGRVHADIEAMPHLDLDVAFVTDPEGHLAEVVQLKEQ